MSGECEIAPQESDEGQGSNQQLQPRNNNFMQMTKAEEK